MSQNLWDTVEAILKRTFAALGAHIQKEERSQFNNMSFHLRKLRQMSKLNSKQAE